MQIGNFWKFWLFFILQIQNSSGIFFHFHQLTIHLNQNGIKWCGRGSVKMDSFVKLARFTPREIVIHLHKTLRSRTGINFRTHGLHVKVPKFVEICKFNEIEVQRRKWRSQYVLKLAWRLVRMYMRRVWKFRYFTFLNGQEQFEDRSFWTLQGSSKSHYKYIWQAISLTKPRLWKQK